MKYQKTIFSHEMSPETFKWIRKSLGLTQNNLAEILGVSDKTIQRYETQDLMITGPTVTLLNILYLNPNLLKKYSLPIKNYTLRFLYKHRDVTTALIDVNPITREISVINYTDDIYLRPFGNKDNPSYEDYQALLQYRCPPENRDNLELELKRIGVPFYDPFLIVSKTKGKMEGDYFSLEVIEND